MRLLYGSPIPEGAVTVVIRPVFGRGYTQALYKGAIEENGAVVDECLVSQNVAGNSAFWSYIDAQKRAGREVGKEDKGIFTWKLSIQFLDQSGAPALVDTKTSVVTSEAHEFYRNSVEGEKQESALAIMARTQEKIADVLQNMQANLADNAKQVAVAVMQPLVDMTDRVTQFSKEETSRADVMTKAAMKGLVDAQPKPDIFDGIAKIAPAVPMALKAIKDLKN